MTDYTKKNLLSDVEDSAPAFGMDEALEAHFASEDLEMATGGIGFERVKPGKRVPFGHAHKEQEEVYVVVEGSGRIKIDDEIVELSQFDAVRIPPGVMRCTEAGPDGIGYLAFGAPRIEGDKQAEAEMVPGWWTD